MADSEDDSPSREFDLQVQDLVHGLDHTGSRPPPQQPSQGDQPSTTELLNSMNKKLDLLQAQYDLSVRNNEALTSLVQTQQQQMNIHLERVDALSTELEQHKDSVKRKEQEDKSTASQVLLHLQKTSPDWIFKDSPDKIRGFAAFKSPSPKLIVPFLIPRTHGWLLLPTPQML